MSPNPLQFSTACSSFSFKTSLDEYSGRINWLKQVWLEGSLMSSSSACLRIVIFKSDSPLSGARSLPVLNIKNAFFLSKGKLCKTSQNHFTALDSLVYPSYLHDFSSSRKLSSSLPQISPTSSFSLKSYLLKKEITCIESSDMTL